MHRRGKMTYRVNICDLSPEGCRAEFVERPVLHEKLWIKFMRSFHPAVFELLIARLTGAA